MEMKKNEHQKYRMTKIPISKKRENFVKIAKKFTKKNLKIKKKELK